MPPSTTTKVTSDHEEIRQWAEARGAKPAAAIGGESGDAAGSIRLDVPGQSGGAPLVEIGWDEWFNKLDKHNLALLYQEHTAGGENSSFNQIIGREAAEEAHSAVGGKGRSAADQRARETTKKASDPHSHGESVSARREKKGREGTSRKTVSDGVRAKRRGRAVPRSRAGDKRLAGSRHAGASIKDFAKN